jgi:alkanesulfonate monooxygenase SsuD/methylene tetrahydromethanopterin reductase-like flavin-dependent oxidoreductase (luciferase family)
MEHLSRRPLKVGLVLPQTEDWMGGGAACWADLVAMAQRAEALGFDSLWLVDHFWYRYPLDDDTEPQRGLWECWSLLAALAAATTRVELGTLVVCTAFRNPALLAKMADTVEEISGGRLILGLGAGYYLQEFRAYGYPVDRLFSRFEEALTIVHGLLRGGAIDFTGTYYQARECELRPRGPRPQGPPIFIGAFGERMLRLTARYADMWNEWTCNTPERLAEFRERVDAACTDVGRDPATLVRTTTVMVDLPGFPDTPRVPWLTAFRARDEPPLTGSPAELAQALSRLADAGVGHVQLVLEPNTLAGIEACAEVLAELDRIGGTLIQTPRDGT